MIGRKQRTRIVFIDGIPIESAILDAGAMGTTKEDSVTNPDALKELDPRALFDKYDADGSGGIDLDEFKVLLHDLHIQLSEPKALAYFKRCDKMRRGFISFEEFRLALYTCDPKNPNRTMGFAPGQALSPKDMFDMFDKEEDGAIDRATFMEVLAFLGHKMPLVKMEGIFAAHEDPETEMMPYYQFKQVWLSVVDVRAEMRNRHEKFSRFLTNGQLIKKLEGLINEEEKQEAMMLLEAATTLQEEQTAAYRRWLVEESMLLSRLVLAEAIDAAGQVYVFGKGAFNRFDGEPHAPDFVEFMDYEVVQDLWRTRVRPSAEVVVDKQKTDEPTQPKDGNNDAENVEDEHNSAQDEEYEEQAPGPAHDPDPTALSKTPTRAQIVTRAAARAFAGRQVSLVTTFLWGRRVSKVALGTAVAYALTDAGEVFCWGGNKRQWRYFYDDATVDEKERVGEALSTTLERRPLTTRTEMLKQAMPSQSNENQAEHDQLYLRRKYKQTFVKPVCQLPTDEQKRQRLELLGKYFDLLLLDKESDPEQTKTKKPVEPVAKADTKATGKKTAKKEKKVTKNLPSGENQAASGPGSVDPLPVAAPTAPRRPPPSYQILLETVEPALNVDDLVLALELRGVHLAKETRMELLDKLADCIALEIECLGMKFHKHMKEQDKAARRAKHDRQERKVQNILAKCAVLWNELRILQEDIVRIEGQEFTRTQHEYLEMKRKIATAKQKTKRQAREGFLNSSEGDSVLQINGLTARGAPHKFFNGDQALLDIAVGSRHALAIRQTGKLLTWGVGSFGRLGGVRHERGSGSGASDMTRAGDDDIDAWHRDVHSPQIVSALKELRFRSVCCGFGHSLALTTQGDVFVWGSATHGKLGIGPLPASSPESFTLSPLRLMIPGQSTVKVQKIACGPSHSALLTVDGALFVWGSGDSGKLGLGDGRDVGEDRVPRNSGQLKTVEQPTRVLGALRNEVCVQVSCGTAHTVVSTAVQASGGGPANKPIGGRVFVAGSNHALGQFTPLFTRLPLRRVDDENSSVVVTRVSCGNAHTALVTVDGELLTWGNNSGGCTGHPLAVPIVKTPTRVSCLYQFPRNVCLEKGVKANQSSQNASNLAEYALQIDDAQELGGVVGFAQTQQEVCPFWEVKLARLSRVEQIIVVFKKPGPGATSRSSQRTLDDEILPLTATSMQRSSSRSTSSRPSSSSSAGVKYVVFISEVPFDVEERGKFAVAKAKSHSVFTSFTMARDNPHQRFTWSVPVDTLGKFVRVQMENAMGMLNLIHVGVVGMTADEYNGPRVSDVSCVEGLTVAICRPLSSMEMLRERFQRAVRADRDSLWILEQLETFHPFVREEQDGSRMVGATNESGDDGFAVKAKCVLCKPKERCVICLLDDAVFAEEMKKEALARQKRREEQQQKQREQEKPRQDELLRRQQEMMRGGNRQLRENKSREQEKNKRARYEARAKAAKEKERLQQQATAKSVTVEDNAVEKLKRTMTLEEKCTKLMTTNMRTQEEEEEAEKRLAAELFAIHPIAATRAQEQERERLRRLQQQTKGIINAPATTTTPESQQLVVKDVGQRKLSLLRRLISMVKGNGDKTRIVSEPLFQDVKQ